MTNPHATLQSFVPAHLVERANVSAKPIDEPLSERPHGALIRAEITGMGALLDALAAEDRLDTFSQLVDGWFRQMVEVITEAGGDVLALGASSVLAFWDASREEGKDGLITAILRASRGALALQRALPPRAGPGGVEVALRIGVGAGPLHLHHVGGELEQWQLVVGGAPTSQAAAALASAAPGQVVLTREPWALVRFRAVGERNSEATVALEGVKGALPELARPYPEAVEGAAAPMLSYVPAAIRARTTSKPAATFAELRPVTTLSVVVPELGPDASTERIQAAVAAIQNGVLRYDGAIEQALLRPEGLAVRAAFGLPPTSPDDAPARAAQAALDVKSGLEDQSLRGGVAVVTGKAWSGTLGSDRRRAWALLGDAADLSGALAARVEGTDAVCDTPTWLASREQLEFSTLPPLRLEGRQVPVHRPLWRVSQSGPAHIGIVGRQAELALLSTAVRELVSTGRSGVIVVEGASGTGKTRLLAQLCDTAIQLDLYPLVGGGDPFQQNTPYFAWRDVLSRALGFDDTRGDETPSERVTTRLRRDARLLRHAPLLNAILPLGLPESDVTAEMTGRVRARATRDLVADLLARQGSGAPTLLVVDDAHWLDNESWALLHAVHRSIRPLLLVLATRPMTEQVSSWFTQLYTAKGTIRRRLEPLEGAEVQELTRRRLAVARLPEPFAALIRLKAKGNPLYTEQMVQSLVEGGKVVAEKGECRVDGRLHPDTVPATVEDIVAERVGRLSDSARLALQVASVIGRVFSFETLHDCYPGDTDMERLATDLEELAERDLAPVHRREPEELYAFRHDVVHEVVYRGIPEELRRAIHARVAAWYEETHGRQLGPYHARVAQHWYAAGDVAKGGRYAGLAADDAMRGGAWEETVRFLGEAIARDAPPATLDAERRRARWERQLGEAHLRIGHAEEGGRHLEAALVHLHRRVPKRRLGWMLLWLGQRLRRWILRPTADPGTRDALLEASRAGTLLGKALTRSHQPFEARALSLRAVNDAEGAGPGAELAKACAQMAIASGASGRHAQAAQFAERALTHVAPDKDAETAAHVYSLVASYYVGTATWQAASAALQQATALAERVEDRMLWCEAQTLTAAAKHYRAEFKEALRVAQAVQAAATEAQHLEHRVHALFAQAEAQLRRGDLAEVDTALDALGPLVTAWRNPSGAVRHHALTAATRLRQGQPEAAWKSAAKALDGLSGRRFLDPLLLETYGAVADTLLNVWETTAEAGRSQVRDPALRAVEALERWAEVFPVARPRALLHRGQAHWLADKGDKALASWQEAVVAARELGMALDEALAHLEIGRRLGFLDRQGRESLTTAQELFQQIGARLDQDRAIETAKNA